MPTRAPGEGSIYKRASDGKWVGVVSLGFDATGNRRRKSFYGPTQRDVRLQLEAAKVAVEQGRGLTSKSPSVGSLLEDWLTHGRTSKSWEPSTSRRHAHIVQKHVTPALGQVRVEKLTVRQVQTLLDRQANSGASPRTVKYTRGVLAAALNLAMRWGLVHQNVAALAEIPAQRRSEIAPLTPDQARSLLEVATGDRLGALYVVAMACALRQSEALALRWSDVDLDEQVLHVRRKAYYLAGTYHEGPPKTELSRRSVAFPIEIASVLRRHRIAQAQERLAAASWADSELVFTNYSGGPLYGPYVTRHLKKVLFAAGLPVVTFKELRHTGATLLLAMGVELRVIQRTLGHTSIATTTIYAHVLPQLQRAAADRMGEFMRGER